MAAVPVLGLSAAPLELALDLHGNVRVGRSGAELGMRIHGEGWKGLARGVRKDLGFPDPTTGTAVFGLYDNELHCADARTTLLQLPDGRAVVSATMTSVRDQRPESIYLSLGLPRAAFAGGRWHCSHGQKGDFAPTWDGKTVGLWNGSVDWIAVTAKDGETVRFAFPQKTNILLQDNRTWNGGFELRIHPRGGRLFARGDQRTFLVFVSAPDGVATSVDKPVVVRQGPDWIPLDYRKDIESGSALDFSNQGLHDAPAGKYGWLRNVNGHFEFEGRPGVRQRLYGVNLCFEACFPDHAFADRLVTRLVRLGYNAVRIHHYESRNGVVSGAADGLALNPERMDRLDYLLAKFYEKGVYVTTDLFTSRKVTWRACGIDRDGLVGQQVYKNLLLVHESAFENWKTFSRNLLTHVNTYTGRAWKDEPGLPLISLVNEGHLTWCWDSFRDEPCLKKDWSAWLAAGRAADPAFGKGWDDPAKQKQGHGAAVIAYMAHIERRGVTRMRAFLKELGVKALLTNQNCGGHYAPLMAVREDLYDYVDDHFYVDHPQFLAEPWRLPSRCANGNPVLSPDLPPVACAYTRMPTKPFCITEWNFSGPGMFRGVGGILTGAMSALQDWDGLWRFSYSHSLEGLRDRAGFPGYFDVASDPLGQAGDRASICLFLRGDLAPLDGMIANAVTPDTFFPADGRATGVVPKWKDAAWRIRTATAVAPVAGLRTFNLRDQFAKTEPPVALKPNPTIDLDRTRGTFRIVTPKTAGGFTPNGTLACGPVAFDAGAVAATVWASALDGQPIATSRRLLITHLTDVQADGNVYAEREKRTLLKWGSSPPIVRRGRAEISLAVANPEAFDVWALETTGRRLEKVPCAVKDGKLVFTADVKGPHGARLLYEVAGK